MDFTLNSSVEKMSSNFTLNSSIEKMSFGFYMELIYSKEEF